MKSKKYTLQDKLTFGRYRGQTIQDVLAKDAAYINWCKETVSGFSIMEDVEQTKHADADCYSSGIEVLKRNPWTNRIIDYARKFAEEAIMVVEQPVMLKGLPQQLELPFM